MHRENAKDSPTKGKMSKLEKERWALYWKRYDIEQKALRMRKRMEDQGKVARNERSK